jgi:hypothetical protein
MSKGPFDLFRDLVEVGPDMAVTRGSFALKEWGPKVTLDGAEPKHNGIAADLTVSFTGPLLFRESVDSVKANALAVAAHLELMAACIRARADKP